MRKVKFILERFKEPSTWASVAAVAGMFAPVVGVQVAMAAPALVAVAGLLGVFLPESKGSE